MTRRQRIILAIAVLLLPVTAAAQTQSQQQPEAPTSFWQQDTLTDDWGGLRTKLQNFGITLGLQEQSEVWSNLTGGLRQGVTYDGLTTASVRIDLDKLAGWSGGTLFANVFQIHGHGPSGSMVGNLQVVSNIEATDSTKLYDLWLEQVLLHGRLNIRIGQEGANDEMMLADDAALFLNSSFGYAAVPNTDLPDGGPNYPMATPFVRLKYQATDTISLVGALYNDDPAPPGSGEAQLRDQTGTAFRLNAHALAFAELWYARNNGAPGLPGTYKLGVWFDSARYPDVLYATNGLSLANPASTGIPRAHDDDYAIYGIVDQMVWQRPGKPGQGIAAFLQVMGAPDDRNLSNLFVEAGLNWKAPFVGRDNDMAGLAVSYEGIGAEARRYGSDLVFYSGTGTPYAGNETVIEATYLYQLTPWLSFQPDAQYVVNPGADIPTIASSKPLKNAFVIGLRATVNF